MVRGVREKEREREGERDVDDGWKEREGNNLYMHNLYIIFQNRRIASGRFQLSVCSDLLTGGTHLDYSCYLSPMNDTFGHLGLHFGVGYNGWNRMYCVSHPSVYYACEIQFNYEIFPSLNPTMLFI